MSSGSRGTEPATMSPSAAFTALGNETRIQILRALAEAGEPLSFSALREEVGVRRGGEFNYHLDKLVGSFVNKDEDGYALRLPGNRVVQAVLSIAVADASVIEPTVIDESCYYCGAPIIIDYRGSHISVHCSECAGNYELTTPENYDEANIDYTDSRIGFLAGFELPPAGVHVRTGTELLRAAVGWQNLERIAGVNDMCPRCSGPLQLSVQVCESHDTSQGSCHDCGNRYAVTGDRTCLNCNYYRYSIISRYLLGDIEFMNFLTGHDIDPFYPESPLEFLAFLDDYEEEVLSIEPFEGRFTFTMDDDAITLTVDGNLEIVAVDTAN